MRPLAGVKVLDFSQMVAGPSCGQLLAEYGADVIKVEPPAGDFGRSLRSPLASAQGREPLFTTYNAGKRCMRLDLRDPGDAQIAWQLIESADVLIETARPGAMDRLGFGYEDVHQRNPALVYASVSAFGWTQAGAHRRGVDLIVQAESGIMSTTGAAGGEPTKVGFTVVDAATAHALTHGILAALLERRTSATGAQVRCSLYGVAVHLQAAVVAEYDATGQQAPRIGNSAPLSAPADLFRCADGYFVLSAYTPPHWKALTDLLDAPELRDDPRFADSDLRVQNRAALIDALEARFAGRPVGEWIRRFTASGLLAGEVKDHRKVVDEGNTLVPGLIQRDEHHLVVRNPVELGTRDSMLPPTDVSHPAAWG